GSFDAAFQDRVYAPILTANVNLVSDASFNWAVGRTPLRPDKDTFNFVAPDEAVAFAQRNRLGMQGHNLLWWSFLPKWLAPEGGFSAASPFSRAEIRKIAEDHVHTLADRYQGR